MFYYNVSEKSKFLRSAKNSNYYPTNYLKTTATEIKENDENEAAHQMLKIPRVGDWENRVRDKIYFYQHYFTVRHKKLW